MRASSAALLDSESHPHHFADLVAEMARVAMGTFQEAEVYLGELLQVLKSDSAGAERPSAKATLGSAYRFLRDFDEDSECDEHAEPPKERSDLVAQERSGLALDCVAERSAPQRPAAVALQPPALEGEPVADAGSLPLAEAARSVATRDLPRDDEAHGQRFVGALEMLLQVSTGKLLQERDYEPIREPLQDIAARLDDLHAQLAEGEAASWDAEMGLSRRPDMIEVMEQARRLLRQRNVDILRSDEELAHVRAELRARDEALAEASAKLQDTAVIPGMPSGAC